MKKILDTKFKDNLEICTFVEQRFNIKNYQELSEFEKLEYVTLSISEVYNIEILPIVCYINGNKMYGYKIIRNKNGKVISIENYSDLNKITNLWCGVGYVIGENYFKNDK